MRRPFLFGLAILALYTLPGWATVATNIPSREHSVQTTTFVIFDLETTGLDPASDRVIEVAAVRLQGGAITERQTWLINPGMPIPSATRRIHGISTEMVADAPSFPQVYTQFVAFLQDAVLLSHNAKFDRRFMAAEMGRHNLDAPVVPLYDTLRLFKRCFPRRRSYSLENLTRDLCPLLLASAADGHATHKTPRERQFHSALWDAECTAALFLKAMDTLPPSLPISEFAQYGGGPLTLKPIQPAPSSCTNNVPQGD